MSNTQIKVKLQGSRGFHLREGLNSAALLGVVTVIERYGKPEGVLIPYEWLMNAHNGDFVQLIHQVKTAVESPS